jgi:hypothetical protein
VDGSIVAHQRIEDRQDQLILHLPGALYFFRLVDLDGTVLGSGKIVIQ